MFWDNSMFLESLFLLAGAEKPPKTLASHVINPSGDPYSFSEQNQYLQFLCSRWYELEFGSHKQAVILRNW